MDIHTYFNLTYSNALILERAYINGDLELAVMVGELQRAFAHCETADYVCIAGTEANYEDLTDEQMRTLDISTNADTVHEGCEHNGDEDEEWDCERENLHWYDWRGDEHTGHEYLTVPSETVEQARAAGRVVLHRTFLQSMPEAWQERFVAVLHRLEAAGMEGAESYEVQAFDRRSNRITDPVPHYQRGRAYVEPRLEVSA